MGSSGPNGGVSETSADPVLRELLQRRRELEARIAQARALDQQQAAALEQEKAQRERINALLDQNVRLEMRICPTQLVPDTNCFIDHLPLIEKLLACRAFTIIVPLIGVFIRFVRRSYSYSSL